MTNVQNLLPHLVVNDAPAAIDFYVKAFDAKEEMRLPGPDGRIIHAAISLGGHMVMLVEEFPEMGGKSPRTLGGSPVTIHLNVTDADAAVAQAAAAGAKVAMPVEEQF
ncbi:VOC family protein [Sandaracinobacteroides hominis]|uniref:VOC family protein n=1 Tax=Sandaracinobacteroides hominis TaxID=2780086 RepID=UPI001F41C538|nr:VOC family protein [Sandaracinobacteroides hominis]